MKEYVSSEIIHTFIEFMLIPILGVLTKLLISLCKSKIREMEQKIKHKSVQKVLGMAENAIETAVVSVNQTFVDTMKKKGTFNEAAVAESFRMAKEKAAALIGQASMEIIAEVFADSEAWLDSKIEYYVNRTKRS
ncbi:hypothetical protein V3851_18265 [Paenibacillus sp. M1]|uniref:Bacteriophage holin of superfamily 6 (Holin_LLH) n=1 Tax=Paenibacillus haidiansis TaxID=1574488 RepID=A0ABU7VVJ2_9BACL